MKSLVSILTLMCLAFQAEAQTKHDADAAAALALSKAPAKTVCLCAVGGPCTCAPGTCDCGIAAHNGRDVIRETSAKIKAKAEIESKKSYLEAYTGYLQARIDALEAGKCLVIGVGCDAPEDGSYSSCRYDAGFGSKKGPYVIVAKPKGRDNYVVKYLEPGATASQVKAAINGYYTPQQAAPQYQPPYYSQPPMFHGGFGGGFGMGGGCAGGR